MQSMARAFLCCIFFYSPCSSNTAIFSIVCVLNNFTFQSILSLSNFQGHDWITNKNRSGFCGHLKWQNSVILRLRGV